MDTTRSAKQKMLECSYVIHEDNFTETMDGITTLLNLMKSDGNISEPPLCRAILLMSHFMIENVFWNSTTRFLEKNDTTLDEEIKNTILSDRGRRIGISEAVEKWPLLLVGKEFDFSREPFSSMRCLIQERNDVTHRDRGSYYSYYIDRYDGAASAYYTALECSKSIKKHFGEDPAQPYENFVKVFSAPSNVLFQKALNKAKNNSIKFVTDQQILERIKKIDEYTSATVSDFTDCIETTFHDGVILRGLQTECDYQFFSSTLFCDKFAQASDVDKTAIFKKFVILLQTLKSKNMLGIWGITLGESLPHVKLKIKKIPFENNHSYLCMPCGNSLIVFVLNARKIILCDLISPILQSHSE